jgi:hypothetical protein
MYKKALLATFALLTSFLLTDLMAGPVSPPTGGGPGNPGCAIPPCVPIDGGLSILIVAGAALGGKKLHDHLKG